jgi:hypothetical protein
MYRTSNYSNFVTVSGDLEEDFEDITHQVDEEGELYDKEINKYKVYQRIYLSYKKMRLN